MTDFCNRDRIARNERTLAAWEDKLNQPPEDFEDSQEFEDAKLDLWDERIADINGYMTEAITEQPDKNLKSLAYWIKNNQSGAYTTNIGAAITKWVMNYCEPENDEVMETFDKDEGV